jgi:hypothetical protein
MNHREILDPAEWAAKFMDPRLDIPHEERAERDRLTKLEKSLEQNAVRIDASRVSLIENLRFQVHKRTHKDFVIVVDTAGDRDMEIRLDTIYKGRHWANAMRVAATGYDMKLDIPITSDTGRFYVRIDNMQYHMDMDSTVELTPIEEFMAWNI